MDTMLGRLDELVAVLHRVRKHFCQLRSLTLLNLSFPLQTQEDSLAKKQALEPALKSLTERLQADYAFVDRLCVRPCPPRVGPALADEEHTQYWNKLRPSTRCR